MATRGGAPKAGSKAKPAKATTRATTRAAVPMRTASGQPPSVYNQYTGFYGANLKRGTAGYVKRQQDRIAKGQMPAYSGELTPNAPPARPAFGQPIPNTRRPVGAASMATQLPLPGAGRNNARNPRAGAIDNRLSNRASQLRARQAGKQSQRSPY